MSNWFVVRLLFESVNSEGDADNLFEDRLVLFQASDEEEAASKARAYSERETGGYSNADGEGVNVFFREILDCQELVDDSVKHETELYHTYLAQSEVDEIRKSLQPMESSELKSAR